MQTIKDILKKFDPIKDKYISREYQSFGIYLAQKLDDEKRKALYIKLAKTIPRSVLEEALRFVIDSNARRKAALFMWKLKQLNAFSIHQLNQSKSVKSAKKNVKTR